MSRPISPGPRMKRGTYIESTNSRGSVVYREANDHAITLRNNLAGALGYTLVVEGPGSFWRRPKPPTEWRQSSIACCDIPNAPAGCKTLVWPEEVEVAAQAVEKYYRKENTARPTRATQVVPDTK